MEILFLGTGSCIPTTNNPLRSFAGFFIDLGNEGLLFDIGPGTLVKMQQSGIDINKKPTHVFVSHLHPDHSADFVGFMQGRGLNHVWHNINDVVIVYGGKGIADFVREICEGITAWKSFSEELKASGVIEVNEVDKGVIAKAGNWKVSCISVKHFNSKAYRLDFDGKSVVYTGDMAYDENFSILGKNADIAIMECSFPDRNSLKGAHLCPEDIGKLAKLGNFKNIILTHIYPECEGREEEMIAKIHEFTDAKVTLAYDLMKFSI